jgi:hypothetical protein
VATASPGRKLATTDSLTPTRPGDSGSGAEQSGTDHVPVCIYMDDICMQGEERTDRELPDAAALVQSALALLALIAGQDVEPAEGSDGTDGRWRIARKVAEDRPAAAVLRCTAFGLHRSNGEYGSSPRPDRPS